LGIVWIVIIWNIWIHRNNIFRNFKVDAEEILSIA